jgi:hypothetical protein
MQLFEVNSPILEKEFIKVNVQINKNDPNYIQPLDKDILEVFDRKKNKAFRHGDAIRWILKTDSGEPIGRIAAFVNEKYKNKGDDVRVGGIGFFDCINDQAAADLLFDVARTLVAATKYAGNGWPDKFWRKGPVVGSAC